MNQQQLRHVLPEIVAWIERTLASHRVQACAVQSLGFSRLAAYYSAEMLAAAKAIVVSQVPVPPLTAMGLPALADFEHIAPDGMTYLDTFFVRAPYAQDESLYFHELVHVAQWQYLGPQQFLMAYAVGHLRSGGYRTNPLEVMAYRLQAAFDRRSPPFDVATRVQAELNTLIPSLLGDTE